MLLSIIVHLVMVILILMAPRWFPWLDAIRAASGGREAAAATSRRCSSCSCSRASSVPAPKPPERALPSDQDRAAASPERAKKPENTLPFSRGNTPDRVERAAEADARAGRDRSRIRPPDSRPEPSAAGPTRRQIPDAQSALQLPSPPARRAERRERPRRDAGGSLGDALRNLQRYTQNDQFDNPGRRRRQFGPAIQFDTKGVEFGPWIRRFIAQVKRNWFIPYAAMSMKGHVVVTVQRAQGRLDHRSAGRRRLRRSTRSTTPRSARCRGVESDAAAAAGVPDRQGVLHRHVLLQREPQ